MSTDGPAGSPSDHFRTLANLIDELEADGYDVVDAEPTAGPHGRLHATVEINTQASGTNPIAPRSDEVEGDDEPEDDGATVSATMPGIDESLEGDDENAEESVEGQDETDQDADGHVCADCGSSFDSEQGLKIHRGRIHGGEDEETDQADDEGETDIWCGVCGDGPFDRLNTHATMAHDGFEVTLDHEPSEAELVESDEDEEADSDEESTGDEFDADEPADRLAEADSESEGEEKDDGDVSYTGPDPREVLDRHLDAPASLENILSVCEDAGGVSQVASELGVPSKDVEAVLWELGLKQQNSRLLVEDVDERVETIRTEVGDD